ncbi:hypothetical protein, partial [Vibrio parahaemolyticus]|uniref:hypothetical protein n=1 Tax=Vibrio parahaemolyticus TaxID=670 RepID=UPI001122E01F
MKNMMNKLITTCLNQFEKVFERQPELGIQILNSGNEYTFLIDNAEIGCPNRYQSMIIEITEDELNNPHKLWRVIRKGWEDEKLSLKLIDEIRKFDNYTDYGYNSVDELKDILEEFKKEAQMIETTVE